MSVNIPESGLIFGEYEESHLFYVEKSSIYNKLGNGICTIEFVLYNKHDKVLMIEAKSSSPKPSNQEDFDSFIDEIYNKFAHSVELYFSLVLNRIDDNKGEMPDVFKSTDYSIVEIKLLLVINGHKQEWLSPI
ncbi:MAG: hypothetical protein VB081_10170, partial [Christensenella sp.]|uniref:hypothetical protein n=1 Tax=Christensenella sp. TaxID=1935934 RepID=UPI002B1FCB81